MNSLKGLAFFAIVSWGVLGVTAMGLDAYEFETTGACSECLILPYVADRFNQE